MCGKGGGRNKNYRWPNFKLSPYFYEYVYSMHLLEKIDVMFSYIPIHFVTVTYMYLPCTLQLLIVSDLNLPSLKWAGFSLPLQSAAGPSLA